MLLVVIFALIWCCFLAPSDILLIRKIIFVRASEPINTVFFSCSSFVRSSACDLADLKRRKLLFVRAAETILKSEEY